MADCVLMLIPRPVRGRIDRFIREHGLVLQFADYPLIPSLERVPPVRSHIEIGAAGNYYLPAAYTPRDEESYFNATSDTGEFQNEVYQLARLFADREGLRSVCDVGCGGAYKLARDFGGYAITGVDVPDTVAWLKRKYPRGMWLTEDFEQPSSVRADVVIAADIIEHLADPDLLLAYIESMQPRLIVLSTPDRNLLLDGRHLGPPLNAAHIREWGYAEFQCYISDRFEVLEHFYANPFQATQMIVARLRV